MKPLSTTFRSALLCMTALALCAGPALAADSKAKPLDTNIMENVAKEDFDAMAKQLMLRETAKPVREMVKGWKKPTKVVVVGDEDKIAWLQKVAPGVKLVRVSGEKDKELLKKELKDADAQIGGACDHELINASGKNLHFVQSLHAGLERCFVEGDVPARLKSGDILVAGGSRTFAHGVAQNGFAMMVALTRGIDVYSRMTEKGSFNEKRVANGGLPPGRLRDLHEQKLLVVGMGTVGAWIGKYAHGVGMEVTGVRLRGKQGPDGTNPDFVDHWASADELDTVLPKADIVAITMPVTSKTTGMVNKDFIGKMKKGAFMIITAHHQVANFKDIVAGLESGQLGAVGTDNVPGMKYPDNDPLYKVPNLLLTPHKGGFQDDPVTGKEIIPYNIGPTWLLARENLRRYVNGDKLYSVVDPKLEY